MDNKITNQASVVTMFHRKNLKLRMLFTGDAYDLHCNIMRTIMAFDVGTDLSIKVDVLKVSPPPSKLAADCLSVTRACPTNHVDLPAQIPHHGSEVTVHASFYQIVRAEVYIVCAAHNNPHVNPRFSTLKAIVRGFSTQVCEGHPDDGVEFSMAYANFFTGTTSERTALQDPLLVPRHPRRHHLSGC